MKNSRHLYCLPFGLCQRFIFESFAWKKKQFCAQQQNERLVVELLNCVSLQKEMCTQVQRFALFERLLF